ncbi:MAG: HU family DNA-binding protein [Pseudomonadota bacterium]
MAKSPTARTPSKSTTKAAPKRPARPRKTPTPVAKDVAPAPAPDVAPVAEVTAQSADVYRKKDLVEAVVAATGQKPRDVKASVEATLTALGISLDRGDTVQMPPLGKIKVTRTVAGSGAQVLTCRIRRTVSRDPLASAAE